MSCLYGRDAELDVIRELLLSVERTGSGAALLVTGDPGIGKTALLGAAKRAAAAHGMLVLRAAAVESESELPYATLQMLLGGHLGQLDRLPLPQRMALEVAFGLAAGPAPDRLLAGLGVLSLLSECAAGQPVVCLVDDAHWMDRASADALLIVMRRLQADPVAVICAARSGEDHPDAPDPSGIPVLEVPPLTPSAAAALLDERARYLSATDRYRVLTQAHGNPLALTELPLAVQGAAGDPLLTAPDAGGDPLPLTSRLLLAFHGRVSRLPPRTQTLLLTAALDEDGDLATVLDAARRLGADTEDLQPAIEAGLLIAGQSQLTFRHPLLRAAVQQRAPLAQRLAVHRALAAALDVGNPVSRDRRTWHLAFAASGPDDELAAALQRTAAQARSRGGHAAAAAAFERAAKLTTSPADASERFILAAEAALDAGQLTRAERLAGAGRLTCADQPSNDDSRISRVEATTHFLHGSYAAAQQLLIKAAMHAPDPGHAGRLLLQGYHAAWYLGAAQVADVTSHLTALTLPETDPLAPLAGYLLPVMRAAAGEYGQQPPPLRAAVAEAMRLGAQSPRDLVQVCGITLIAGDDQATHEFAAELVSAARAQGASGYLPTLLFFLAEAELFHGQHREAAADATESMRIAQDTGQGQWVRQMQAFLGYIAAVEGDTGRCQSLTEGALHGGGTDGPAVPGAWALWALGMLDLGHGRVQDAHTRLLSLVTGTQSHHVSATRAIPDLVEAAVRVGAAEQATAHLARFERWADFTRQPWAAALVQRCQALLAADDEAEASYAAALREHAVQDRPLERARTMLLYGEWLRRARRRSEARPQLTGALEIFERLDAAPWARRARAELDAAGAPAPTARQASSLSALTPQELQVIRLAARGLTNRDIAAQLFLSPRTVGYHLYKAYPKLGIASRAELAAALGHD